MTVQGRLGHSDLASQSGGGDPLARIGFQHLRQAFEYLLTALGISGRHDGP
jgi:hypothetical protein